MSLIPALQIQGSFPPPPPPSSSPFLDPIAMAQQQAERVLSRMTDTTPTPWDDENVSIEITDSVHFAVMNPDYEQGKVVIQINPEIWRMMVANGQEGFVVGHELGHALMDMHLSPHYTHWQNEPLITPGDNALRVQEYIADAVGSLLAYVTGYDPLTQENELRNFLVRAIDGTPIEENNIRRSDAAVASITHPSPNDREQFVRKFWQDEKALNRVAVYLGIDFKRVEEQ